MELLHRKCMRGRKNCNFDQRINKRGTQSQVREAQPLRSECATGYANWNLANCCTTVQISHIKQPTVGALPWNLHHRIWRDSIYKAVLPAICKINVSIFHRFRDIRPIDFLAPCDGFAYPYFLSNATEDKVEDQDESLSHAHMVVSVVRTTSKVNGKCWNLTRNYPWTL